MNIPKCMSTQHPDNVNTPFFSENSEISGEDEIKECFYAFSHLGCDEQMWDCEGKEIDIYVVKKLLTKYANFFEDNRLGRDCFLTLRIPNPTVEKAEAKILVETLESIPRSFDASNIMYGDDIPPIFEIILPMVTSSKCINRVYMYYRDFVVGKQYKPFNGGDITIADWIGHFSPDKINCIPLVEDMEHMLDAHNILKNYIHDKEMSYHRIFLARSDPAMNYGLISAVLINKIALQNLYNLSEEINIDLYPIIGVGSAPFRGNLRPETVDRVSDEYPYAYTFTIQSAFKYDNPPHDVMNAIKKLKERTIGQPRFINEQKTLEILNKYKEEYAKQITLLAPLINRISKFIPSRRKRKLHIGLFGYARSLGDIKLPRAIRFTAALYSIGIPPEILGINILSDKELEFIQESYINFEQDLVDALKYYNPVVNYIPTELKERIKALSLDYQVDEDHKYYTDSIIDALKKNQLEELSEDILIAASIRKFLG